MYLAAALLLAFHVGAADPAAETAQADPPKKEKLVCKRSGDTRSRMGSKRVCKTAEQWRKGEVVSGESTTDLRDDPRIRDH